ncbi:MAG: hypothetical protein CMJ58_09065 [Planctomycetaceae bacterium]|nr:hypothetical protein [Planctomycetaceae bacterium]
MGGGSTGARASKAVETVRGSGAVCVFLTRVVFLGVLKPSSLSSSDQRGVEILIGICLRFFTVGKRVGRITT